MSNVNIEEMSLFELARWYSIVEAVNIIADECDRRGKNFNKIKLSPLNIEKYIEGTCDIFARKIESEQSQKHRDNILVDFYTIK